MKLTPHFSLSEFISPRDPFRPSAKIVARLAKLASVLELLRVAAGRPLTITSGFRSPAYNALVGGKLFGYHPRGEAADLAVTNNDEALTLLANASRISAIGGIGYYPGRGFIHVDIRPRKNGRITAWICIAGKYRAMPEEIRQQIRARGGQAI